MTDYKFSKQIKMFSIILIIIGAIGIAFGFYSAPSNVEEAKEIVANMSHDDHGGGHGGGHSDDGHGGGHSDDGHGGGHSDDGHGGGHSASGHEYDHDKHVFHQFHNKPLAAVYVPAFFFLMIPFRLQCLNGSGWS